MTKTLLLIRHAHRDVSDRDQDNGLTDRGRKQAEAVCHLFQKSFGFRDYKTELLLLSSGKRRCVETLAPIAELTGVSVKVDDRLMEVLPDEGRSHFENRIRAFLDWVREDAPPLTAACSHGDWIPVFMDMALGKSIDLNKGAWAEIEFPDDSKHPHLKSLLQNP